MWWVLLLMLAWTLPARGDEAIAFGRGACGKVTGAEALPCSGENFEAATRMTCLTRRNHLHPLVAATVVDAYAALRAKHPRRRWQYGEMGFPGGGRFPPHRTHQNGLSADFFVPVVGERGFPETLSIRPWNLFGYRLDFDDDGKLGEQRMDFTALGDHLVALRDAGKTRGVRVALVILHLPLQRKLVEKAPQVKGFAFNQRAAWVQHDEHYHVDFEIPARLRRTLKCP